MNITNKVKWYISVIIILFCNYNFSIALGAEKVVLQTGSLHYNAEVNFAKQWRETLAPSSVNKRRWEIVKTQNYGLVLRAGSEGNTLLPFEHRIYDDAAGEKSVFDVSGAGRKSAFRAFTDFCLISGPQKPMEAVRVNLAVVSIDGSTSYTAALYSNSGNKMFTNNRLRIDKINFKTGRHEKSDNIAFQKSNIKFKPGFWYRLEFVMIRQREGDRSPVELKVAVYELINGVKGGKRGKILKELSAPMLPNIGEKVQFGMIGATTSPYVLYLDNFGAEAKSDFSPNKQLSIIKNPVSATTQKIVKYFMDRKHEYKKGQGTITLASDGKPQMVIVVPDKAPGPVRYAGKELKFFLDKITGGKFKIVNRVPADGHAIILGDSQEAKEAGIDVNKIARDGYRIIAKDNSIIIAGKDDSTEKSEILFSFMDAPDSNSKNILYKTLHAALWSFQRGTLYGVYRFLEELDVRWFLPGPKGMFVPSVKNLNVPAFSLLEEPAFDMRRVGPHVWGGEHLLNRYSKSPKIDFEARYRELGLTAKENRLWILRMRGSTMLYPMGHRVYDGFIERFQDTHPEYFALHNGKRNVPRFGAKGRCGLPCFSSKGRISETLKDIDAFFAGKSTAARGIRWRPWYNYNRGWAPTSNYGNIVSLLPHDAVALCECEQCKPKISLGRSGGQNSDLIWGYTAEIAKEVQKRWPGKMISQLAYASQSKLPLMFDSLPDNVLVGICFSGLNKTYNLQNSKNYDDLFDLIKKWDNMNALPVTYWFHHLYRWENNLGHYAVPMQIPHFFKKFIKDLSKHGHVMFMQMDRDNYMFEHLNRYVLLKLLYNPDLDVNALIDDYVNKFYGPAAGIIKPMLLDIEKRSEGIAATEASRFEIWSSNEYFGKNVMAGYRKKADEAVKLTAGTPYAEATHLFSKHFIGFMEQGSEEAIKVAKGSKKRDKLLRQRTDMRIKLPYSKDGEKNLNIEFMPVNAYRNFQKSFVTLSLDDKYFTINLSAHESKITKLKAKCKTNDKGPVWSDDSFEIMLIPPNSKAYYQIIVNSLGVYRVVNCGVGKDKLIKTSRFKLKTTAKVLYADAGEWRAKVQIPLSQFPSSDFEKVWRFNIFRNRCIDTPDAYQASGIYLSKVNFHIIKEYPKLYWNQN